MSERENEFGKPGPTFSAATKSYVFLPGTHPLQLPSKDCFSLSYLTLLEKGKSQENNLEAYLSPAFHFIQLTQQNR